MVKYIYAGFSKCGTKTMAAAFRNMGYSVYDFDEMMEFCTGDLLVVLVNIGQNFSGFLGKFLNTV